MDWLGQIGEGLDSFFNSTSGLSKQMLDIIAVATIVIGVLFCFFGYRFIKYLLFMTGFFSGALIGLSLYYYIPFVNQGGEIAQLSVGAVTGLLVGLLFYFIFYHFSIFIFGAVAAMWLAMVFLPRHGQLGDIRLLLILGAGLLGGLLGFLIRKIVFVTITAILGAVLIVYGLGHFNYWPVSISTFRFSDAFDGAFIESVFNHPDGVVIFSIAIIAAIAGFLFQFFSGRLFGARQERS